jgi:leucyl aminopeptidase
MALYKFDKFKTEKIDDSPDLTIIVSKSNKVSQAIKTAIIVADGTIFTKSIANLPPNECTPSTLANFAKIISKKNKMKCNIISKSELKKRGFGGITAVGQGSKNEPKLIVLEHNRGPKNEKPIVLVGKAVTFDTGGISLKPGEKMDEMKFDKCGGCTVLGIMKAVSELKLPINVVGIVPSVENMPGGESYRPGDIIKLYNGKTAEILNTDAEGRLILADALSYGEKHYSPKAIIDFATLTGACIVALGTNVAGIVSNNEKLTKKINESSKRTMEEVWTLPLNQDFMDMIKSEVADMKNIGIGRAAGTITAAAFLRNAIEDTPWIHTDIAGVAWTQVSTKEKSYNPKGATGFGVRLILDYLQNM